MSLVITWTHHLLYFTLIHFYLHPSRKCWPKKLSIIAIRKLFSIFPISSSTIAFSHFAHLSTQKKRNLHLNSLIIIFLFPFFLSLYFVCKNLPQDMRQTKSTQKPMRKNLKFKFFLSFHSRFFWKCEKKNFAWGWKELMYKEHLHLLNFHANYFCVHIEEEVMRKIKQMIGLKIVKVLT